MVQVLFDEMLKLDFTFSNGMKKNCEMKGPGFFPGCIGIISQNVNISEGNVMVLGQDFDTYKKHQEIKPEVGEIENNATWRNLKKLLSDINIDPTKCFFTNAYMGLRSEGTKNTGASPASKKEATEFALQCHSFFKKQMQVIQPKLVLVLGKETARFLTKAFPSQFSKWVNIQTLKKFYEKDNAIINDIEFEGRKIRFVFVIHPSMSNINRSLIWGKDSKDEIRILREALHLWLH